MKQIILAFLLIISVNSFSQTGTSAKVDIKADSIQRAENNKIVLDILKTTSVKDLEGWLYKNMTAEKYNEFLQFYNLFIQEKFNERKKKN